MRTVSLRLVAESRSTLAAAQALIGFITLDNQWFISKNLQLRALKGASPWLQFIQCHHQ
ncbi:hypothetical protein [Hymenobacter nivis]|uniref:hypothetical protein n=1 Tax=Hymenobacter nivis TaxID=1850093 RepID=UPI0013A54FA2|nr:hypothetical protein [Hymenobacter nivis]